MTSTGARKPPPSADATSASRCDAPIDLFYAAHLRHRRVCAALAVAAEAPVLPADELCALSIELADDLHQLDCTEQLLFDLLRRRAEPDDDITHVLAALAADHAADRKLLADLATALRSTPQARLAGHALVKQIERFVTRKLRSIALENAVVLPIARLRLTRGDLALLAARFGEQPCNHQATPQHGQSNGAG